MNTKIANNKHSKKETFTTILCIKQLSNIQRSTYILLLANEFWQIKMPSKQNEKT